MSQLRSPFPLLDFLMAHCNQSSNLMMTKHILIPDQSEYEMQQTNVDL